MNSKNHHIFHLIKRSSLLIEVSAFISMLCMSILILNTILLIPIHFNGDSYYHLSRIFNLHGSWINFLYPQNFTTLGRVGIATNIFYPAGLLNVLVNLIPSQIGALGTYRLTVVLILYLNMLSMYVVLRYFVKTDVLKAILSAILWGSLIITFDIGTIGGEILAKTAFPFIAVGLYYFQSKKGWILLSLGILLSISSHILTTLFLLTFSVIYIVINFFKQNADKKVIIFNSFKTTIFTILVSLYVVVPMIVLYANNKITNPNQMASAFVDYQQVYLSGIITNPTFVIMAIIIELPVFGYAGTNINVYINNKSTKYFIQNGRISINKSLTKEDSIRVVQSIPTWRIIPFIISGTSIIFLIILLFPFQKIKLYYQKQTNPN